MHNAHMYYLLLPGLTGRTAFIENLKDAGIGAVFHYIPLHSSPAGMRYGRAAGALRVTEDVSARLVRMPLWAGLEDRQQIVVDAARSFLRAGSSVSEDR
jgi:dTDP-4-amino-4,6-dideoxygalactose transaminase